MLTALVLTGLLGAAAAEEAPSLAANPGEYTLVIEVVRGDSRPRLVLEPRSPLTRRPAAEPEREGPSPASEPSTSSSPSNTTASVDGHESVESTP